MKFTSLVLFFSLSSIVYSQGGEILSNGGFESYSVLPHKNGIFSAVSSWTSRTFDAGEQLLHSPDYMNSRPGGWTGDGTPAQSGNGYVGMLEYELMQQKISPLESEEVYVCSFYFRKTTSWSTANYMEPNPPTKIKIHLAKNELKYKSEQDANDRILCTSDYKEKKTVGLKRKSIHEVDITDHPLDQWIRVEFSFVIDKDEEDFEYFVVETQLDDANDNTTGQFCARSYVYLDDFSLKNICDHECAPDLDPVQVRAANTEIIDLNEQFHDFTNQPITVPSFPFLFFVENAQYVSLQVFSSWGQRYVDEEWYDPMGLHSIPTATRQQLMSFRVLMTCRDGNNNIVGPNDLETPDVSTFILIVKGCNGGWHKIQGSILWAFDDAWRENWYDDFANDFNPIKGDLSDLQGCCDGGSIVFSSSSQLSADEVRQEGSITFAGNINMSSPSKVYKAGEFIDMNTTSAFTATEGNAFDFLIAKECAAESGEMIMPNPSEAGNLSVDSEESLETDPYKGFYPQRGNDVSSIIFNNFRIQVFPNPIGEENLKVSGISGHMDLIIHDMEGKMVFVKKDVNSNDEFNLSHLPASIYSVEVVSKEDPSKRKVIRLVKK